MSTVNWGISSSEYSLRSRLVILSTRMSTPKQFSHLTIRQVLLLCFYDTRSDDVCSLISDGTNLLFASCTSRSLEKAPSRSPWHILVITACISLFSRLLRPAWISSPIIHSSQRDSICIVLYKIQAKYSATSSIQTVGNPNAHLSAPTISRYQYHQESKGLGKERSLRPRATLISILRPGIVLRQ